MGFSLAQYAQIAAIGLVAGFVAIAIANRVPNLPLVDPGVRAPTPPTPPRT